MKTNQKGIELMHKFEGLVLDAYLCPANVPTIGYGNTYYEDGSKVKMGDKITKERAEKLFLEVVSDFETDVKNSLKTTLNDNQFSALVSFTYNLGVKNLRRSTLLKKVNINPKDPSIKDEFLKWNRAGGRVLSGLTKRREEEAKLYFS